jgi:Putative beta-barrel porin-2, OmpL-like. bbp2
VIRSIGAAALVLGLITTAGAQTNPNDRRAQVSTPAAPVQALDWTYGGFLDVAYPNALNDPFNKLFRSRGTAWHVDDLYLNMSGVYAKKKAMERSRWGTELLVQSGKDDEIFGFSATAPNIGGSAFLRHLGLANVSYLAPVGKGLTIQGGIFTSLIGYDSLYAKDNFNYTRPWGADLTPYLMLGVNASYPFTEKLTGTLYVVNGYWHLAHANNVPSSGMQLAYKATPQITVKETVLAGPHQTNTSLDFWRFLSDTIVERRWDRLVIAGNFHVATENVEAADPFRAWWVAAQLPVRWNVRGPWSVAVRPELARDSSGRWTLAEQTVRALTTTLEYKATYKWANAILRFEHRVDTSTGAQGGFFDDFEVSPGNIALLPTQHLLVFAAILTLDSPSHR